MKSTAGNCVDLDEMAIVVRLAVHPLDYRGVVGLEPERFDYRNPVLFTIKRVFYKWAVFSCLDALQYRRRSFTTDFEYLSPVRWLFLCIRLTVRLGKRGNFKNIVKIKPKRGSKEKFKTEMGSWRVTWTRMALERVYRPQVLLSTVSQRLRHPFCQLTLKLT